MAAAPILNPTDHVAIFLDFDGTLVHIVERPDLAHAPTALLATLEDAYAALEEYVVLGYGGSSGEALPADVWARLRELRELLDAQVKSGT